MWLPILRVAIYGLLSQLVSGFLLRPRADDGVSNRRHPTTQQHPSQNSAESVVSSSQPLNEMSEERKANLFPFLLRDLQIEGVPLLEVDSDQVHTLQAALWTTLSEMSVQDDAQKACLIFPDISISTLRTVVDDFMMLKTQTPNVMAFLPELERYSLSLVGKGVGPAILIDASAGGERSQPGIEHTQQQLDDNRYIASMKMFVDRMNPLGPAFGDTSDAQSQQGVPTRYRVCKFSDAFHVLSSFWNCVCEALAPDQIHSTMLLLPAFSSQDADRCGAISELVSQSFCLHCDGLLNLAYFYPGYDRDRIQPSDKPVHGHMPALSWLRSMLRHYGNADEAQNLTDEDLRLLNFQRRSPVFSICISPVDLLAVDLGPADDLVSLELDDGSVVQVKRSASYSRRIIALTKLGESALQASLKAEMDVLR